MSTTSRRALVQFAFCVGVTVLLIAGILLWQQRRAPRLLTLAQALWVTERDGSRLYPPGSPPSRTAVAALAQQGFPVADPRFGSFVLYRQGLTNSDAPTERLLVVGFVPPSP